MPNKSVTETPVALFGPLLVAVIVKITAVPNNGALLLTVLVTDTSVHKITFTGEDATIAPQLNVAETV